MDWNVLFSGQANPQPLQGQAVQTTSTPDFAPQFKERLEGMIEEAAASTLTAGAAKSDGLDELGEELRSIFQTLYDKVPRSEEEEERLDVIGLRLEQWHALRYRTAAPGQQDVHNQPLDSEGIEQISNNVKRLNVFREVTTAYEKRDADAFLLRMVEELPYLAKDISVEAMNTSIGKNQPEVTPAANGTYKKRNVDISIDSLKEELSFLPERIWNDSASLREEQKGSIPFAPSINEGQVSINDGAELIKLEGHLKKEWNALLHTLMEKGVEADSKSPLLSTILHRMEQWDSLHNRELPVQHEIHRELSPDGQASAVQTAIIPENLSRAIDRAFDAGDILQFIHLTTSELPYLADAVKLDGRFSGLNHYGRINQSNSNRGLVPPINAEASSQSVRTDGPKASSGPITIDVETEETIKSSVVEVLRNFLQQMRTHPSKSISKTFSMNPEQLGKMTVQYTAESGEPVLDIKVENKAAFTLLKPLQADIRTQLPLNQLSLTLAEGNRAAASDVRTEGEHKPAAMTVSQDLSKRVVKVLERVTDGRQAPSPQSTTLAVRNAVVAQQQLGLYETGNRSGEQKALGMAIRSKEALDPWTAPSASIPLLQKEAAARIDGNADKAAFQVLRMSEQPAFPLAETKTSGQEMKQWVKDLEQFVQKSRMLTDLHGNKELRIQMKPGNLGDLTVKVAQINGEMVVKLMVGSQSAKEVIEGNLHHLRHVFSPHQVVVERTDTPAGGLAYQESKEQEESGSKRNGQGSSPDRERDDTEEDGPTFEELLRMNEKV